MKFEKIKLKLYEVGFTGKEIKVIIFLTLIFFIGSILKIVKYYNPNVTKFDYSSIERKFENYSLKLDSGFSNQYEHDYQNNLKNDSSSLNDLSDLIYTKPKKSALLKDRKIDINSAPKNELMLLPNIGPRMAERIIVYRTKHKKFTDIKEMRNIQGIGEKKYNDLKKYVEIK